MSQENTVTISGGFTCANNEEDWNQGYHSEEKLESLKQIFEVAMDSLANENCDQQKQEE